jgi:hypothetical protein
MGQTLNSEALIIQYLLGELSEAEQLALEEEYFADREKFDRIKAIENDLIEGYVCGKLSPADRERFEKCYLSSPQRREQVQFFQTLAKAVPLEMSPINQSSFVTSNVPAQATERSSAPVPIESEKAVSWWQAISALFRGPKLAVGLSFAMALLILALGGTWLLVEHTRLRERLAQTENERATLRQREQELQRQIEAQREQSDQLAKELESVQQKLAELSIPSPRSALATVPFAWTISGVRASDPAGEPPRKLIIPPGAKLVQLKFKLSAARYQSYRVALQTLEGSEVWSRAGLRAHPARSGASVLLEIPAKWFNKGAYVLTLSGSRAPGEFAELNVSHVEIDKR